MADKIINFSQKRKEAIEQKRREFERVMFTNFLGCHSVLDEKGNTAPIDLVDISENGCLLQVPLFLHEKFNHQKKGEELNIRIYFTPKSYLPVNLRIKYVKEFVDGDEQLYMRYGCEFDKSTPSFEALLSFIKFIYKFAEYSCIEKAPTKSNSY